MSKGLRNFPPEERSKIARRRLMSQTKGLGYLAAKDYMDKKGGSESGRAAADRPNDNTRTEP